jgi:cation:H+ antiporter
VLSAGFGIVLLGIAALAMAATTRAPVLGWFGLHSLIFIAVYGFAMRTIFVFERTRISQVTETLTGDLQYGEITLSQAVTLYIAAAAVLVAAAAVLPGVAERLAAQTGLNASFVGSILVAAATTLPEAVVSIAAARLGAMDMALGTLFGSNLFNMAVLGVDDLLYTRGSLLMAADAAHMATLVATMVMTAIAIVGLTYRAAHKRFRLSWDAFAILAVYLIAAALLHRLG